MSSTKKIIAAALILLIIGGLICGAGYLLIKNNPEALELTEEHFSEFDSEITGVDIDVTSRNVEIVSAEDGFRVDYFNYKHSKVTVDFADGILSIKEEVKLSDMLWGLDFDLSFIALKRENVTVYVFVPETLSKDILINGKSCSILLSGINIGGELGVKLISGNVKIKNAGVTGDVNISTTSGNLTSDSLQADNVNIDVIGGNVKLNGIRAEGTIAVGKTSGNLNVEGLKAAAFNVVSVSGNTDGTEIDAIDTDIKSTSGRIKLKFVDTKDKYVLSVSTNSGRSNVVNQSPADAAYTVKVTATTSGNINLYFA
ncbi:MAG: DUF4097 domain-containing protein [Clostridiales bacterium]|jgi:lia operon protein LiaG|nr:DUF4097 domain-containing protein [Clostridiales bacterium]